MGRTYSEEIRRRLRAIRADRQFTAREASLAAGWSPATVGWLENGRRRNLYLSDAVTLLGVYRAHPAILVDGWTGWKRGRRPPEPVEQGRDLMLGPDAEEMAGRFRVNLRAATAHVSQRALAENAWGNPNHASTISRWLAGEYERLDLIRIGLLSWSLYLRPSDLLIGTEDNARSGGGRLRSCSKAKRRKTAG